MEKEIWKPLVNYENIYAISNFGNIKSLRRESNGHNLKFINERILKLTIDSRGYNCVCLYKNKQKKTFRVHQLMAISFLNHKRCKHRLVIDHINFNRLDNRIENLKIITNRENTNRKHIKSSSKYTGVSFDKSRNKWISSIYINGKNKNLGRFNNEEDASIAYQNELKKI